jgi:hypothetical protein
MYSSSAPVSHQRCPSEAHLVKIMLMHSGWKLGLGPLQQLESLLWSHCSLILLLAMARNILSCGFPDLSFCLRKKTESGGVY